MQASGKLTSKRIDDIAAEAGLDVKAMRAAMAKPELAAALAETRELGAMVGVDGTPAFLINGEIMSGWSQDGLTQLIAEAKAG